MKPKKSEFFPQVIAPAKHRSFDIQKSLGKYTQLDLMDKALKAFHQAMIPYTKALENLQMTLDENTHSADYYFSSASPHFLEEVHFITSVATSLYLYALRTQTHFHEVALSPLQTISCIKDKTLLLQRMTKAMPLIIDGSYLYAIEEITAIYRDQDLGFSPSTHPLHSRISQRILAITPAEKASSLRALHHYLNTKNARANVRFGSRQVGTLLANIEEQIYCAHSLTP
ncbi:MAG: hypothetical protein NTW94_03620 [Legionellales bacterium]|nr:hypothetical protein [Legionellales bacterium]